MNFGCDEEQEALQRAVRDFCRQRADLTDRAGLAGREGQPADPATWAGLIDLGVFEMLAPAGAADAGAVVEAAITFEILGTHLVTGPVLWSALAGPLIAGVQNGNLRVTGLEAPLTAGPVVVAHAGESAALLVVHPDRVETCRVAELEGLRCGHPLDPLTPVAVLPAMPEGERIGGRDLADRLRLLGAVLSAAALVGVAQGALDVARSYALEREQFGRPIGSFQAVKHILADMYVRIELARSAAYAAAATVADPRAGDPIRAVAAAKVLCGDAGIGNGRAAVQVLGGMGFTWDMPPHYYLKRAWVLEQSFGTAPVHAAELAAEVAAEVGAEVARG